MENLFEINESKVKSYFYLVDFAIIIIFSTLFWFTIIAIPLGLLLAFIIAPNIAGKQVKALKYWIEGSTLHIEEGIFLKRKIAIPLEKITDITMIQGPILRRLDIWHLQIQTAGTGAECPEGKLYGLKRPEEIRKKILKRREEVIKTNKNI